MADAKKSRLAALLLLAFAQTPSQQSLAKTTNPASEYNGVPAEGLLSRSQMLNGDEGALDSRQARFIYAQADDGFDTGDRAPPERRNPPSSRTNTRSEDDNKKAAAARAKLKEELARIRARDGERSSTPPPPAKKKTEPQPRPVVAAEPAQRAVNPEIDRLLSRLLLLQFTGKQASDGGVKAIHTLLQSGHIAGAVFSGDNIVSKSQLREMMKFLWPQGHQGRPIFAIREFGGNSPSFPIEGGFEPWPSQQAISSKGDPQYAYSVYQTLASNLAKQGFNMNFGPSIIPVEGPQSVDSFGKDPLQIGVFAKTFVLGHRDAGVIPVPVVDGSDTAIRALKTLLVSYPETPVAVPPLNSRSNLATLTQNATIIRGTRFCFVVPKLGAEGENAAQSFRDGCDVLILTAEGDLPTTVRQRATQAVAEAVARGELSLQQLTSSSQKFQALRSTIVAQPEDMSVQTEVQAEKHSSDNF